MRRTLDDKLALQLQEGRRQIKERAAENVAANREARAALQAWMDENGIDGDRLVDEFSRARKDRNRGAAADPDARSLREADFKRMRRVPRVKTLRRALGFTQEEFATRYQIPVGILRDWEQGRAEPDPPARAYLKVIARDPEHVHRLLQTGSPALVSSSR